jgi:hypothetical protein
MPRLLLCAESVGLELPAKMALVGYGELAPSSHRNQPLALFAELKRGAGHMPSRSRGCLGDGRFAAGPATVAFIPLMSIFNGMLWQAKLEVDPIFETAIGQS